METDLLYSEGQTYKIGLHGNVFVERGDSWFLTNNLTVEQFNAALKKQNRK